MKQLARVADERWASKPSFLDKPQQQQSGPATVPKDPGGFSSKTEIDDKQGVREAIEGPEKRRDFKQERNTQNQRRGAPGEDWQPEAWTPGATRR